MEPVSFAALIVAVAKAIPALQKIFEDAMDIYWKQQSAADQDGYDKKKAERDALITAMMKPGVTDNELKDLRRALYELNRR